MLRALGSPSRSARSMSDHEPIYQERVQGFKGIA